MIGDNNYKSVATWIPMKDYAMLQHLAFKSKVTVAAYIRAIIIDATQDELYRTASIIVDNTIQPSV